jgi:hypothetical protein
MRPVIVLGVAVVTLCAAQARAGADPSDADRARDVAVRGTEAAASGDLRGAIALFKEARAIDDRAEYLCNIGYAYQLLAELPRAHLFLSECLVRGAAMDVGVAAAYRTRLADVENALRSGGFAPIDVTVTPRGAEVGASVFATDETAPGPRVLWLPPGHHTITATAPGHEPRSIDVDVAGTARHAVSIELAPVLPPITGPVTAPPPAAETWQIVDGPPPNRRPALIAFAGGGVALAAGGVFHVLALRTRDDIAANYRFAGPARDGREATWRTQVTGMTIGYGVGVVAVGVGAFLWWRSGRAAAPMRVPIGDGGAALVGWHF